MCITVSRPESTSSDFQPAIPEAPGVYAILVHGGAEVLARVGFNSLVGRRPLSGRNGTSFYVGSTATLFTRIRRHVAGEAAVSTFRRSMLALQLAEGALTGKVDDWSYGAAEKELTAWLQPRLAVAWTEIDDPRSLERRAISPSRAPLNIELNRTGFARKLIALRTQVFGRTISLEAILNGATR